MAGTHPTSTSRFPPDEETLGGYLMLRVARGDGDHEDLREWVTDSVDELEELFEDQPSLTTEEALAVLDEVVAEHERLVLEQSRDAAALVAAFDALAADGIATSFGDGWDTGEGAELGYVAARALGADARGYLYCTTQDLDGLVLGGALYVGYSGMTAGDLDESAVVGRAAYDALTGAGLTVEWDGDPRGRLLVAPVVWARPLLLGRVRERVWFDSPGVPDGDAGSGRSWWQRLTGR